MFYRFVRRIFQQFVRIAVRDDRFCPRVQINRIRADRKNGRQFVRYHNDRRMQIFFDLQNQIVQIFRTDRIKSRGRFVKNTICGSSAKARARPARFFMPPLISAG